MANEPLSAQVSIKAGTPKIAGNSGPVTLAYVPRNIRMYSVAESELDGLLQNNGSLDLLFFGICFGALVSFASALLSSEIRHAISLATLIALLVASWLVSMFFGISGWRKHKRSQMNLQKLKQRPYEADRTEQ